jgi:hypothetical protein
MLSGKASLRIVGRYVRMLWFWDSVSCISRRD